MKKFIAVALALLMLASLLVGCTTQPMPNTTPLVEMSYQSLLKAYDRYTELTQMLISLFDLPGLEASLADTKERQAQTMQEYEAYKAASKLPIAEPKPEPIVAPEAPSKEETPVLDLQGFEETAPMPTDGSVCTDAAAESEYFFVVDHQNGNVMIDGLLDGKMIQFALPEGFELMECLDNSYIYFNGIATIALTSQKTPKLPMPALLDSLQEQTVLDERFDKLTLIDSNSYEEDDLTYLVLLFETGENEATNMNWVKYVIDESQIFQLVYSLGIDAEEEAYYAVGEVFDSIHIES